MASSSNQGAGTAAPVATSVRPTRDTKAPANLRDFVGPKPPLFVDPHGAPAPGGAKGAGDVQPPAVKKRSSREKPTHLDKLCGTDKRFLPQGAERDECEVAAMVLQKVRDGIVWSDDYAVGRTAGIFLTLEAFLRKKGLAADKAGVAALGVRGVDALVQLFEDQDASLSTLSPVLWRALDAMTHAGRVRGLLQFLVGARFRTEMFFHMDEEMLVASLPQKLFEVYHRYDRSQLRADFASEFTRERQEILVGLFGSLAVARLDLTTVQGVWDCGIGFAASRFRVGELWMGQCAEALRQEIESEIVKCLAFRRQPVPVSNSGPSKGLEPLFPTRPHLTPLIESLHAAPLNRRKGGGDRAGRGRTFSPMQVQRVPQMVALIDRPVSEGGSNGRLPRRGSVRHRKLWGALLKLSCEPAARVRLLIRVSVVSVTQPLKQRVGRPRVYPQVVFAICTQGTQV